jgi:hypothetical protein
LLARCKAQIAVALKLGEDAAREGDRQTAWAADAVLKQLRLMKSQLEQKLGTPSSDSRSTPTGR